MCITMRKVVLHDILSQIFQNLGFIIMFVAILAAILDFSVSSRTFACYLSDFYYRGANDTKSIVKNFLIPSRVCQGGTLTKSDNCILVHNIRTFNLFYSGIYV